jgi:hypothetical protein
LPGFDEGVDQALYVEVGGDGAVIVKEWGDEV